MSLMTPSIMRSQSRVARPESSNAAAMRSGPYIGLPVGQHRSKASKPTMLPVTTAAEAKPLTIESMRPVGNYAYNILFSDGHHSGLFTLDLLHNTQPATARGNEVQ